MKTSFSLTFSSYKHEIQIIVTKILNTYFNEDVDQSTQVLMLTWSHLEQFRDVEEHGWLLKICKILALHSQITTC